MTFVDTGVLVGLLLDSHPDHRGCINFMDEIDRPLTNAHALAETFSTLTGFYRVPVQAATELTLSLLDSIPIEPLSMDDYLTAIGDARKRGVMGGGIYDALHATFARRKNAAAIGSRNESDFRHVAPDIPVLTPGN